MKHNNAVSLSDPYPMPGNGSFGNEQYNYAGRVQESPALVPGENTAVILTFGDSLSCATESFAYTPTNAAKVQNFSLQNGGIYRAANPALSCSDNASAGAIGIWAYRLGDKLINAGTYARVIFLPMGYGGTATGDWKAGGTFNYRFQLASRRLASVGLTPTFILQSLGGADQIFAVPQATVRSNLNSIVSSIRSAGFSSTKILMAMSSWGGGGTGGANGTAVRAGITQAIGDNANVFAGADTDTIPIGNRYDNNHFDATGSDSAATLWKNAMAAT